MGWGGVGWGCDMLRRDRDAYLAVVAGSIFSRRLFRPWNGFRAWLEGARVMDSVLQHVTTSNKVYNPNPKPNRSSLSY